MAKKNRDLQDDSQPAQTVLTDAGLESLNLPVQEPEQEYFPGYCLNAMELVKFSYPKYVMGALYHCPNCGVLAERYDDSERGHIFEPSARLVRLLEKSKDPKVRALIGAVGSIYNALASNAAPFEPVYALRETQEAVTIGPEWMVELLEAYLPFK